MQVRRGVTRNARVSSSLSAASAEQSLILGQNRIDLLFSRVKTRVIEETELQQLGYCPEMFRNLNTPEEWKEAELKFGKENVLRES